MSRGGKWSEAKRFITAIVARALRASPRGCAALHHPPTGQEGVISLVLFQKWKMRLRDFNYPKKKKKKDVALRTWTLELNRWQMVAWPFKVSETVAKVPNLTLI